MYHPRSHVGSTPRSISNELSESAIYQKPGTSSLTDMPDRFPLSTMNSLPANCADPIAEFTRFLTHGDDLEGMLVDPSLGLYDTNMSDHGMAQNPTPDSIDISLRVPGDPSGDG